MHTHPVNQIRRNWELCDNTCARQGYYFQRGREHAVVDERSTSSDAAACGSRAGIWLIYESESESRAAFSKDGGCECVSESNFCTTQRCMQSGTHGGGNSGHRSQ